VGVRSAVDVSEIHAAHLQDSEGGENMYLRNVGNAANIPMVQRPKIRINMSYRDSQKSVKVILTDTNPALQPIHTKLRTVLRIPSTAVSITPRRKNFER
jgi:hypothetical protein